MNETNRGFTLIEVVLAIMVMATGILGMCGLYSLGFRESRASVGDVATAAFGDTYLAPLVQGLSSRSMTWSQWCQIGERTTGDKQRIASGVWPENGWLDYVERKGKTYRVKSDPGGTANTVFNNVLGKVPDDCKGTLPSLDKNFSYALVVTRIGAKIQLAFRASQRRDMLMSQPLVVAEVHFQGDPDR